MNVRTSIPRLTWNRFDVAFKLALIEEMEAGLKDGMAEKYYGEHIKAFSLGSFIEPDTPEKNSLRKYLAIFQELNEDIKTKGFNADFGSVPVANDGSILNGAHRTSICIYHKKPMTVCDGGQPPQIFDYEYFKTRGASDDLLDFGALNYVKYSNNIYLAFIWPAANVDIRKLNLLFPNVVYSKKIKLNYNGAHNLLAETYAGEPWLGSPNENYPGIKNKLIGCFTSFEPVEVILFNADSLESVLEIKEKVRDVCNIGKHSIHITDNKDETMQLSFLVYNKHSLDFINNAFPRRFGHDFERWLSRNCSVIQCNEVMLNAKCSLHLYGLKKFDEFKNIVNESFVFEDGSPIFLNKHIKSYKHGEYFYFKGVRCLSLYNAIAEELVFEDIPLKQRIGLAVRNNLNNFKGRWYRLKFYLQFLKEKYRMRGREIIVKALRKVGVVQVVKFFICKLK